MIVNNNDDVMTAVVAVLYFTKLSVSVMVNGIASVEPHDPVTIN